MTATLLAGIGASIAVHRRAVGITQADLASRIGRSVQWVSAVEQGRRHAERLSDLVAISAVLGCTLDDLLGRPVDTLTPGVRNASRANVEAVRTVMLRSAIPNTGGTPTDPSEVRGRVAEAWSTWHGSPTAHTALGSVLPGLLTDAIAVHQEAEDKRVSARTLAGAWQITRQWLHHLPEGDLAWIAADRAMQAAREADDPHLVALAAWALSASYRRAGQPEEATRLCLSASDEIAPLLAGQSPDAALLAANGMLHLSAAVSAAQSDDDGRAWVVNRSARTEGTESARSAGATGPPLDTRDPARPWTVAASAPASDACTPDAMSAPAIPASTSPDPPAAIQGVPSDWL